MEIKKINLTLPRHWNACTREQLEMIASVMCDQVERQDRYHPFDMRNVKIALFFAFTGLEIVKGLNPAVPMGEQHYTCRLRDTKKNPWWKFWRRRIKPCNDDTFSLFLWQINYWLSPKAETNDKTSAEYMAQGKGILDWLDNDHGIFLTRFMYDEVNLRKSGEWWKPKRIFHGPGTDLDGFSWAQYRFATDTMQSYTQLSNSLLRMKEMQKFSDEQIMKQIHNVDMAKSMFLATIFNGKTKYVDTNTGMVKYDYHYESNQCTDNAQYFRNFPETEWQVILFWWTGMMHTLSKRYPHVFKVQKVGKKKKPSTPLEIYTATTATMQKYAGLTEDQVNNQSYSLVLEHLERLSKENEEMEKIRRKK